MYRLRFQDEFGETDVQSVTDRPQFVIAHRSFPAFDPAHIRAVDAGIQCQSFLTEIVFFAKLHYGLSEIPASLHCRFMCRYAP